MFLTLLLKTLLPFGLPIVLIAAVLVMARKRFAMLQSVPLWIWLAVLGLLLVLWALVLFLRWRKEKADAAAIEAGIMEAQGSVADVAPARRAEIEQIQKNLHEAIAQLKQGPQGKKALYTIPWYMIIGPPAIGKTTAILNSGLNFPNMTTAKRLRGQGGTRNCDWWFSTDAILLDTAGRYTQSMDRSETEGEWFEFLTLLKGHRKRNPINGLIVGYSAETMVEQGADRIINDARELRQRIDEIMTRTGFSFPVYLLFTKCDLISGFTDFFGNLSPVERQQVWGTTFPIPADPRLAPADYCIQEFDGLVDRLRDVRLRRLAASGRTENWGRTFLFPEEFVALRPKVHVFLETLFEKNPFSVDQPLFRGAYFSSGKQIGTPFESVVQKIQSILGGGGRDESFAEEQVEKDDAYFVRDLFSKVFQAGQDLSRQSQSGSRKWLRARLILAAGVAVASLIACALVFVAYARLGNRMKQTESAVTQFEQKSGDLAPDAATLAELHDLRDRVGGNWRAWPLSVADNVRQAAHEIYLSALRQRVLQPIEKDLAEQLDYPDDLDGDSIRRLLRAELLLLYPEKKGEVGEAKELADALFLFGIEDADDHPEARGQFEDMAKDFLEAGQPLREPGTRESELSNGARGLRRTHGTDAFFRSIIAGASREKDDLTLERMVGEQDVLTTNEKIEAAYTQSGWNDYVSDRVKNVSKVIEEDNKLIILAGERPADAVPSREDLVALYVQSFPIAWGEFVESVRMKTFTTCEEAAEVYKDLKASQKSPLLKLFRELGREATFGVGDQELAPIAKALEPLRAFSEPAAEGDPVPVSDYRSSLGDVEDQLAQCAEDPKFAFETTPFRKASGQIDDFFDRFESNELTDGMKRILVKPIDGAKQILEKGAHQAEVSGATSKWDEKVYTVYRVGLAGKYPFKKGAGEAAQVSAIIELLSSGGALQGYVDGMEESELEAGGELTRAIRNAEKIRGSFGLAGGLESTFRAQISAPRSLGATGDANLKVLDRTTLIVNGKQLQRKSSDRAETFTWDSGADNTTCAILIEHTGENRKLGELRKEGSLWSWFQLVDQGSVARDGDAVVITWEFPDAEIAVDCRITMNDGGECPFVSGSTFRNFTLPESPL